MGIVSLYYVVFVVGHSRGLLWWLLLVYHAVMVLYGQKPATVMLSALSFRLSGVALPLAIQLYSLPKTLAT